ncbi:hypothetical protein ACFYPC_11270 [Streptomyces sp. NPDC005808]|uniref:hypothetical protein n=1 Tax=Streptomyces sp. NPDC005808 TaxID=3364734 RepID=UPI0036BBFC52
MNQPLTPAAWDAEDNRPAIPKIPHPRTPQTSDLAVAVDLGRRVLGSDNPAALREALRILLYAVEQDAVRRSVDAQFPAVAALLDAERGEGQ